MFWIIFGILFYLVVSGIVKVNLDEKIKRLEIIEEMRLEGWDVRELIKREMGE